MSNPNGRFIWYELMTSDTAAAAAFYGSVVGWEAKDSGVPGVDYTLLTMGGNGLAGLMALPEQALAQGARPAWIGYVAVDDVDAMTDRFAKAGGAVHKAPADIPGVGRFAVLADPQGATIAVFRPGDGGDGPPMDLNAPGRPGWHELMAGDEKTAFAFYSEMFGWTTDEEMDMGPMGIYRLFALDGERIGGMMTKPDHIPRPNWGYYFNINGTDAAKERVEAGGGQVVNGPMEVPGGQWIVNCIDPQGAMFSLVGPTR